MFCCINSSWNDAIVAFALELPADKWAMPFVMEGILVVAPATHAEQAAFTESNHGWITIDNDINIQL
nr:hypothetical protein [Candidatus Sigynarchaeota archaeon]